MWAARLAGLFKSVLTEGNTERKLAEAQIKELSDMNFDGFVDSCLAVLANKDSAMPSSVRHLSAATLKQAATLSTSAARSSLQRGAYSERLFLLMQQETVEPIANMLAAVIT